MFIKSEPEKELKLFELFLLPGSTFVMAFMSWLWAIETETSGSPHTNLIWLVGLVIFTYEIGYKKYFKVNRKSYFMVVFSIPLLITIIGTIGGYV